MHKREFISAQLFQKYKLIPSDMELLYPCLERVVFDKKDILLAEGQLDRYVWFVEQGIVRSFILREAREFTLFFAAEGDAALSSPSLAQVSPAQYALEAVEDSVLWRVSRLDLANLMDKSVGLANWGRKLTQNWLSVSFHYFTTIYWMNKQQQYLYLIGNNSSLAHRLPLKDLASWLDITPQSLSRIRANLAKLS